MFGDPKHSPAEVDDLLAVLSNRHARAVCEYFHSVSADTATVDDIVHYIGERYDGEPEGHHLEVDLHHVALPKLEHADLVRYDTRDRTVRYTEPEILESVFDRTLEEDHVTM